MARAHLPRHTARAVFTPSLLTAPCPRPSSRRLTSSVLILRLGTSSRRTCRPTPRAARSSAPSPPRSALCASVRSSPVRPLHAPRRANTSLSDPGIWSGWNAMCARRASGGRSPAQQHRRRHAADLARHSALGVAPRLRACAIVLPLLPGIPRRARAVLQRVCVHAGPHPASLTFRRCVRGEIWFSSLRVPRGAGGDVRQDVHARLA